MDHTRSLPQSPTIDLGTRPAQHAAASAPVFSRLAIVDRRRQVLAYALPIVNSLDASPKEMTEALHLAYRTVDLAKYVADRPAFIWATVDMLSGEASIPPSGGGVGLLIHPSEALRADGAENIIALSERSIRTILVDFTDQPGQRALLPFVSHVMIDIGVKGLDVATLVEIAHNAGVSVIAENVHGKLGPARAWDLGVDYIMGSIYQHEKPQQKRNLDAGEIQCLETVRLLAASDVDTGRIAEVLSSDPEMTVRVLHLVNSVAIGLPQRVDSLHRAIIMLGPTRLTTLVMASLISSRVQQMDALWYLLARAAACRELIGDDTGYTVGLLSAFSEETGIPVGVLVEKSLVSAEVADALENYEGPLGAALAAVIAHEQGDIAAIVETAWTPDQVARAYLTALPWALETVRQLNLT
ncbi:EAL and modified HD-GYP domain-containing signal transduction protein [Sanguibacter gelidistatuariae]|uniref:EAL and modified HD-GYP domain-containing signal transduction protein n=1 Tax=Sanguibacter gelidistatuariae TaxID=1814289 RepID=A0A1G6PWS2_9MICO|nr:HDOD domain-containing protein [Sanguibacter gelidistatuariae]SDC83837.1 EAL and modified HD-GYP domain-containing signal transduction protein [Sanguibacter gelidistatuariae]